VVLTHIIYSGGSGVLLLLAGVDNGVDQSVGQLLETVSLTESVTALLSQLGGLGLVTSILLSLELSLFLALDFTHDASLVIASNLGSSGVKDIIHTINVLVLLDQLVLSLSSNLGDQVHTHGQLLLRAKASHINHDLQVIALEVLHEVLNENSGQHLLLGHLLLLVCRALLQNSAVLLLVLPRVGSLHSLSLNELRLSQLLILGLVLGELAILPLFNHLDLSLIKGLSHQNLQNRPSFSLKVKDRLRVKLVLLINTIKFRHKNSVWRHINVKVGLNVEFVHLARNV